MNLPEITGLAWLEEDLTGGEDHGGSFASVQADGTLTVWDIYSGLVSIKEKSPGEFVSESGVIPDFKKEALSPDGEKKLLPALDGGICLLDIATRKELARYYFFGKEKGSEWICITPEGVFNASFGGSSFLTAETGKIGSRHYRRYRLDQLSGALFRPDIFRTDFYRTGKNALLPLTLADLFDRKNFPPLLSVLPSNDMEGEKKIHLKITEQKGGTGPLALYRKIDGIKMPDGLLDPMEMVFKKYTEKGSTCYELELSPALWKNGGGEVGISVFNGRGTVESEPVWLNREGGYDFRAREAKNENEKDLFVLLAVKNSPDINDIKDFFSLQASGDLYSGVNIKHLYGEGLSFEKIKNVLDEFRTGINEDGRFFFYLQGEGHADEYGNLIIIPGEKNDEAHKISYQKLLQLLSGFPLKPVLILDLTAGDPKEKMETALLRFRLRLGPKAILAAIGAPGEERTIQGSLLDILSDGFTGSVFTDASMEGRYLSAADFLARSAGLLGGRGMVFYPREDFFIIDPYFNTGELKFQTMASGMLKIDKIDKDPVPLVFGSTMVRPLPPGSYIIDMIYRNGYRETKSVNLGKNESRWVIFNYTPPLLVGNFREQLPSLGINLSELNPVNYEKVNREAMEGMGMAPYYVAYLSGEKFYKDGNFDTAITEYSRSISLKSDYTDAYVSRGNARRRKGEFDRAIEDYNRALNLEKNYAEVFNYRGFCYAQKGDFNRAISDYTQAIRQKPDLTDVYFNRAYAYGKQESWEKAIADYTQVIKAEPGNRIAYNERGNAWSKLGDTAKAQADYAAAEKQSR